MQTNENVIREETSLLHVQDRVLQQNTPHQISEQLYPAWKFYPAWTWCSAEQHMHQCGQGDPGNNVTIGRPNTNITHTGTSQSNKTSSFQLSSPTSRENISNIARIANAVQCHNWLSGNKDCHEFRFSIVRIVISVSNVTSLQDCLFNCQNGKSNCLNCENCRQLSAIVKNCQNCKQMLKFSKL